MADLLSGIGQLLWADATVKAMCPGGVDAVLRNENGALPALTYQMVGGAGQPGLAMNGPQRRRIQIDAHAVLASDAYALRNAVREVLDGFQGQLPNGFAVQSVWLANEIDFNDNESRQVRAMAEYYVLFGTQPAAP